MKICILGGLGHIGSGLVRYLLAKYPTLQITIIDNFSTGKYHSLFGQFHLLDRLVELDVRDDSLERYIIGQDIVLHLAAITKAHDFADIEYLFDHNLKSTKNVKLACEKLNVPLIFLSSTSIYEQNFGTVDEKTVSQRPKNKYALSKYYEEEVVSNYSLGLTLRLGTIHGISPGMNFHTAVNRFCWNALNNLKIPVWEDSYDITSPYLSLRNLIKFIDQYIIVKNISHESKVLNLVSHNSSPNSIVKIIQQFMPEVKVELINKNNPRTKNLFVTSSNSRIKQFMNEESIGLDIEETFNLFNNRLFTWDNYYNNPALLQNITNDSKS
jgi:nucleoside-diphosphate-sugar epimerase